MVSSPTEAVGFLRNTWYVVGYSSELTENKVLGREILGVKYALYRANGVVRMVEAACPHRGADLSRGAVSGDCLRCPMHGWEFDGEGACVKVPSQPHSHKIPPRARLELAEVREQQGLIWAWLGDKDSMYPAPAHDEWAWQPGRRQYFEPPRLWKCSFVNAVENAIDTTHIPFMHVRTLGEGSRKLYPKQELEVDADERGFWGKDSASSEWGEVRA